MLLFYKIKSTKCKKMAIESIKISIMLKMHSSKQKNHDKKLWSDEKNLGNE
jgi:hypothetical protein